MIQMNGISATFYKDTISNVWSDKQRTQELFMKVLVMLTLSITSNLQQILNTFIRLHFNLLGEAQHSG